MREFKIYAANKAGSPKFIEWINELEKQINDNQEIIESAKKCNLTFYNELKEIMKDEENALCVGSMLSKIQEQTPRYSYIKQVEYDGVKYDVEIDELNRVFRVIPI